YRWQKTWLPFGQPPLVHWPCRWPPAWSTGGSRTPTTERPGGLHEPLSSPLPSGDAKLQRLLGTALGYPSSGRWGGVGLPHCSLSTPPSSFGPSIIRLPEPLNHHLNVNFL